MNYCFLNNNNNNPLLLKTTLTGNSLFSIALFEKLKQLINASNSIIKKHISERLSK